MNKSPIACGLYTRVSTRNQLQEEYSSLETQRERLEAYCKSQEDYGIYRVYEDGAYSADTIERPALKEMIRDIKLGKINCVLVYKIDRITRSVKDFHRLMELFDRYGVKFVSITQSIDTQSPTGRLLRNILLDFAQFEREMTADRTRDKMQQRAMKGLWNGGIPSFGYYAENKKLIPHPEEAQKVQFMFRFFAKIPSLAKLRDELNRRNWPSRSGRRWGKTSIDNILRNSIYTGKIQFNGKLYEGQHEPLIDERLFRKVQSLRREQGHSKSRMNRTYLLKGLLKCSDCGSMMTPHYTQKRRKDGTALRIPYYRCSKTMHFNNGICKNKSVNADLIEDTVVRHLADLSLNEALLNMTLEELNQELRLRLEPLEREAGELKRRIDGIEAEITKYVKALGKGKISIERLEKEIEERENEKQALLAKYEEIRCKMNEESLDDYDAELVRKNLQDFQKLFQSLTPKEKAEALQCVLQDVTVHPDKLVLNIFELPEFSPGSKKRTEWLPR